MKLLGRSYTRRGLLRTLTVGAGAYSLAPGAGRGLWHGAGGRPAWAADLPRRLVIFASPNGLNYKTGWDGSWVKPPASGTSFATTGITTPLEPHRDELVFFDGIDQKNDLANLDTHNGGQPLALTGAAIGANGRFASPSPSIDQHIAERLGKMTNPKWPSYVMVVHPSKDKFSGGAGSWSRQADGTRVRANEDILQSFANLLGNLTVGGASGAPAAPDPAVMNRLAMRKSILDGVAGDLQEFQRRLPAADRVRAEAQLGAIRTLEQRLGAVVAPAGRSCSKPSVEKATGVNLLDSKHYELSCQLSMDLIYAALACDVTRVVLCHMTLPSLTSGYSANFAPINYTKSDFHQLSHDEPAQFEHVKTLQFKWIASFVDKLKNTAEAGGTMLDNTLIYVPSEIASGHTWKRMPLVTIGGKNLGVKGGRYLTYPAGTPHSRVLSSIVNAMGIPTTKFGNPAFDSSPLPDFTG